MHVVGDEALLGAGQSEPVRVVEGAVHVVETALPVRAHFGAAEGVVLALTVEGFVAVDQVDDVVAFVLRHFLHLLAQRVAFVERNALQQIAQNATLLLRPLKGGGDDARAAGKLDVFLPLGHVEQGFGHLARRAP